MIPLFRTFVNKTEPWRRVVTVGLIERDGATSVGYVECDGGRYCESLESFLQHWMRPDYGEIKDGR